MIDDHPAQINPVMAANTGSMAKMSATLVGVVYFCTDVWIKKAKAVANTDVTINAIITLESNRTSAFSIVANLRIRKIQSLIRIATVAIWMMVNSKDGKLLLYFPV